MQQLTQKKYTIKEIVQQKLIPRKERTIRQMIAEGKLQAQRIGTGRGQLWVDADEIRRVNRG